jgi:trans-2,3-dihydro-3-hydroxyanthranilate isomerase
VGQIPVAFTYKQETVDELWMTQKAPQFGRSFNPQEVAASLSLEAGDLDERFPVQEVSTGLPFMIVPLKTLDAMKRAETRKDRFFALVEEAEAKAALLFCPETYRDENDLNVRVFVDHYNVPEDPATGSANGCLAAYLVKTGYFASRDISVRVEQGYEIGRPSLLLLKADSEAEEIRVRVGGRVIKVAEGRLIRG